MPVLVMVIHWDCAKVNQESVKKAIKLLNGLYSYCEGIYANTGSSAEKKSDAQKKMKLIDSQIRVLNAIQNKLDGIPEKETTRVDRESAAGDPAYNPKEVTMIAETPEEQDATQQKIDEVQAKQQGSEDATMVLKDMRTDADDQIAQFAKDAYDLLVQYYYSLNETANKLLGVADEEGEITTSEFLKEMETSEEYLGRVNTYLKEIGTLKTKYY